MAENHATVARWGDWYAVETTVPCDHTSAAAAPPVTTAIPAATSVPVLMIGVEHIAPVRAPKACESGEEPGGPTDLTAASEHAISRTMVECR